MLVIKTQQRDLRYSIGAVLCLYDWGIRV